MHSNPYDVYLGDRNLDQAIVDQAPDGVALYEESLPEQDSSSIVVVHASACTPLAISVARKAVDEYLESKFPDASIEWRKGNLRPCGGPVR